MENLPPELLVMIAEFALSNQFMDAAAIARVNHRFYDILIQTLYKGFLQCRKSRRDFLPMSQDAMHFALSKDRPRTLSKLIEAGANPSTYFKDHIIYTAIECRSPQGLRFLLKNGTDVEQPRCCPFLGDSYPLRDAILENNYVAMEILLKHGADANKKQIIHMGSYGTLVKTKNGMVTTISRGSASHGAGAKPSTELRTPLSLAMHSRKKTAIRILLQHGASPEYCLQQMGLLESTAQKFVDWRKKTDNLEILVAFLEGGLDLKDLATNICYSLFDMTLHGAPIYVQILKGLLRNGAWLPRYAFHGTSFLHKVLQYVNKPIPLIEVIVDSGQASVHDRDNRDWGTVHYARHNLDVVKWLVERGASTITTCTEFASVIQDEQGQGYVELEAVNIILGMDFEEK